MVYPITFVIYLTQGGFGKIFRARSEAMLPAKSNGASRCSGNTSGENYAILDF
jgi:hypothetical protein